VHTPTIHPAPVSRRSCHPSTLISELNDTITSISIFIYIVSALKCYSCISRKDWDTCKNEQTATTCDPSMTACLKVEVQGEGNGIILREYAKMCVQSAAESCNPTVLAQCKNQLPGMFFYKLNLPKEFRSYMSKPIFTITNTSNFSVILCEKYH
jgi:hypothetical protein